MIEQEITLSEILLAREERVAIQNALLAEYKVPVISFTMNIAGPVKVTALSHRAFLWGLEQLRLGFLQNRMTVKKEYSRSLPTGDEAYFAVDAPAERVKALCVEIEEANRMGRFFDMDVIGTDGNKLDRGSERDCIVCHKPGRDCASRRLHTVAELQAATAVQLSWGLREDDRRRIGALATRALLEEVARAFMGTVPCTACRYCCADCPVGLDIPTLMNLANEMDVGGSVINILMRYSGLGDGKRAGDCIACGQCSRACPQKIDVPEQMRRLDALMASQKSWEEICLERERAAEALGK